MTELAKAKCRVKQLEKCLRAVQKWISDEYITAREMGANNDESDSYVSLCHPDRRVRRTMPAIYPRGLYSP